MKMGYFYSFGITGISSGLFGITFSDFSVKDGDRKLCFPVIPEDTPGEAMLVRITGQFVAGPVTIIQIQPGFGLVSCGGLYYLNFSSHFIGSFFVIQVISCP